MFRKLVANLSFSPALISEVGFYAHRLRQETATRRLTAVFMILALIVQSLAVFSPPESANASSDQDLLRGGVNSKEDFISRYDTNESNIKDILTATGITKSDLERLEPGTVNSKDHAFVTGHLPRFGTNEGEVYLSYKKTNDSQNGIVYLSPLNLLDGDEASKKFGTTYQAWIGQSAQLGWFAILHNSGNLVAKVLPSQAIKTETPGLAQELLALNLSQGGVAADSIGAEAGDRVSYTITARNDGDKNQITPLAIALNDVLEYSALIDNGGGLVDEKSHTLSWSPVTLAPGQSEQRTFVVQLFDPLPATPRGQTNTMSYDCMLTNSYGTTSQISVNCPSAKEIESVISFFPTIGAAGNLIFGAVVGSLVLFFYLRTRQLKEEIRLIRHNLNEGAL